MNCIWILLFCVNYVISSAIFDGDKNNDTEVEPNGVIDEKTNFMNLNVDCTIQIFKELPLYELLSLTETNKHLRFAIEPILKQKLTTKCIQFFNPYHYGTLENADGLVDEYDDRIEIRHFPTLSRLLRYFGQFISSLRITHDVHLPQELAKKIFQLINLHCSSLEQLHITNDKDDFFEEFNKPFVNMKALSLDGVFVSLDNSMYNFSEIFPSLYHLNLQITGIENLHWLDETLPNLEHLSARIFYGYGFTVDYCKRFLQHNRQITFLSLEHINPDFLQFIANKLPLEHLEIEFYDENLVDDGPFNFRFQFDHLKTLKITRSTHTLPANIVFRNLEVFITDGYSKSCTRWIDLVKNQPLKIFKVIRPLNDDEISQLANAHLNLSEATIMCARDVEVNNLIELIEHCQQLEKLQLHIESDLTEKIFDVLHHDLAKDWVVIRDENQIFIERKQYH